MIGQSLPSSLALSRNCTALAQAAGACQREGILPLIQIEMSRLGDHDIHQSQLALQETLRCLVNSLSKWSVHLNGLILACSFSAPGLTHRRKIPADEVAEATLFALSYTLPPAIAGCLLTDDGLTDKMAISYLQNFAIHNSKAGKSSRNIGFCFGMQQAIFSYWGSKFQAEKVQQSVLQYTQDCVRASLGQFTGIASIADDAPEAEEEEEEVKLQQGRALARKLAKRVNTKVTSVFSKLDPTKAIGMTLHRKESMWASHDKH
eukprot:NODE_5634_length_989_cov_102.973441_g5057_i0.p1 GENE.NODE_5634_length_989_cov_102.973441_g5057_i0~~NODE_5634_length_989_cov_102.973441_g5057_i0.p1  ORF type:complete len:280 (+),score=67.10 NODE_5634_length_989_cov_102.973441_g5057_i0:57-842(+)